ncbi:MAG: hypothetical protein Q7W45_13695 [Bacteroidota bacterium]|nr:hypothetical protein [Bacteroidota bacterium]MDP3144425.1 hypothetical protein [Bacteroidota bacterium]MDP3555897.1 hypothetical protein [Bacteroidota bacterium]
MNKISFLFSGLFLIFLVAGCEKKVGKTAPVVAAAFTCDSIKYASHIQPIITKNCAISGCHISGFSSGDFTSYAGLNTKVVPGKFKLRVFDSPNNPMPPSGQLPQAQLDSIKCWLDRGAPND